METHFCDRLRSFAILRSYGNQSSSICDRIVSYNNFNSDLNDSTLLSKEASMFVYVRYCSVRNTKFSQQCVESPKFLRFCREHNARVHLTFLLTKMYGCSRLCDRLRSSAIIWKQLSLRSSAICDLRSAIVCDRLRSYGNQPLNSNIVINSQMGAPAQFTCDLYVNCSLFFFSSEIPDAYSSQKVSKKTTVDFNMPL